MTHGFPCRAFAAVSAAFAVFAAADTGCVVTGVCADVAAENIDGAAAGVFIAADGCVVVGAVGYHQRSGVVLLTVNVQRVLGVVDDDQYSCLFLPICIYICIYLGHWGR